MAPIRTLHPPARDWLLDGPLSAVPDPYLVLLERGRYAKGGVEKHLRALVHFSDWMTRCRLTAVRLDEFFVDQFLKRHLPRCDCHATALRKRGVSQPSRPGPYARLATTATSRHSNLQHKNVVSAQLRH